MLSISPVKALVVCRGQRPRRRSGHGAPHAYGDQCENIGRIYDLSSVVNYWLARDERDGSRVDCLPVDRNTASNAR